MRAKIGIEFAYFLGSSSKEFLSWSPGPSWVGPRQFDIPNFNNLDNLNALLLWSKDFQVTTD